MHISNRHLDLEPVLANLADSLDMVAYRMRDGERDTRPFIGKSTSNWVAIAHKEEDFEKLHRAPNWATDKQWPDMGPVYSDTLESRLKTGEAAAGWQPLGTIDELESQLEKSQEAAARLEEKLSSAEEAGDKERTEQLKKDLDAIKKPLETIATRVAYYRRVGVWTDDYSNLLSVFTW
jgi:hypothetical protein